MTQDPEHEEQEKEHQNALPEGMGFGSPSAVYDEEEWPRQREKLWPRQIHQFGMRQNQVNRGTTARLRALEVENRTLRLKIEQLEKELEAAHIRERKSFGRVAILFDRMQAELDRVRLSTQLNSNAIDRMVKGSQAVDAQEKPDNKA